MHELAAATFNAIEEGDLSDLFDTLHVRVFGRSPQDLLDVALVDGVCQWQFKPMVELLLHHIAETASKKAMPAEARATEILRAVDLIGF